MTQKLERLSWLFVLKKKTKKENRSPNNFFLESSFNNYYLERHDSLAISASNIFPISFSVQTLLWYISHDFLVIFHGHFCLIVYKLKWPSRSVFWKLHPLWIFHYYYLTINLLKYKVYRFNEINTPLSTFNYDVNEDWGCRMNFKSMILYVSQYNW